MSKVKSQQEGTEFGEYILHLAEGVIHLQMEIEELAPTDMNAFADAAGKEITRLIKEAMEG